jgi:nicotinamide-nucleotide amidase
MDSKDIVLIDDQVINNIRDILIDRNETLAIAESVTCGILQTAFGSATDASLFFQGGITAYNLGQKSRHLHINPIHAENCDCVSDTVATEMAVGVCSLFASHWGIAVTGYATIDPEIKMDRPFAHFSIAHKGQVKKTACLNHPEANPQLIQYFYVNEIVKTFLNVLGNHSTV